MSKGSIGKRILRATRFEDIEILGEKIRIRPMTVLHQFAFRSMTDPKNPEEAMTSVFQQDRTFVARLVAECAFDPESGEPAFEEQDAALLPGEEFTKIMKAIMDISKPPEKEEVKA